MNVLAKYCGKQWEKRKEQIVDTETVGVME